jgi:tetratricopeptide (TPR) repeat protein
MINDNFYKIRTFAFGDLFRCNLRRSLNVQNSASRLRLAFHPKAEVLKINLILLLWAAPGLCAFSNASIKDVETAVITEDYEQAKGLVSRLLSREAAGDVYPEALYYMGLCELRLGNYTQAAETFTQLTKEKIQGGLRDKTYLGLFDAYYMDERYDKAYTVAKKLLKSGSKSEFTSLIYLKYARVNLRLARWKEAGKYLDKVITDFPDSMEVHAAKQLLEEEQYFAVQVGAFMDRARAEKFSSELQQKGQYAYIVETVDQKDNKFYRVRVGQLTRLNEAQQLKTELSSEGYPAQIYP